MKDKNTLFNYFYVKLLSSNFKKKIEIVIVSIAIFSFILHLSLIGLSDLKIITSNSKLLINPIAAIYTPFSFILIYEVYLLVYYLPKSTTIYIGKQYEIITLIIIRRTFKDLSNIKFNTENYYSQENFLFAFDLFATLMLFFLIFIFYKLNNKREDTNTINQPSLQVEKFIYFKKIIAMFLIPIFLILSIYSLGHWIYESFTITQIVKNIKDINKIFFDEFFTILILVEVLILLVSFFLSDKFSKVIRNSGFVISTILIKLSFATEGFLNTFLILIAVLFGVLILLLHNKYEIIESKKIVDSEV